MITNFSDHAANERTFLAWVRTAMALVGFGLAIAHLRSSGDTPTTAYWLVGIGGLVVLLAYVRMHLLLRRLDEPRTHRYALGLPGLLLGTTVLALFALCVAFALHIM